MDLISIERNGLEIGCSNGDPFRPFLFDNDRV